MLQARDVVSRSLAISMTSLLGHPDHPLQMQAVEQKANCLLCVHSAYHSSVGRAAEQLAPGDGSLTNTHDPLVRLEHLSFPGNSQPLSESFARLVSARMRSLFLVLHHLLGPLEYAGCLRDIFSLASRIGAHDQRCQFQTLRTLKGLSHVCETLAEHINRQIKSRAFHMISQLMTTPV